jgi:hypothetical protein
LPGPHCRSTLAYDTLSACYCSHVDVMAWCHIEPQSCWRYATLDLIALIFRHGDLAIDDVRRRLICKVCGRRSYSLQVVHQPGPIGERARRELLSEVRKKLIADRIARGMSAVADVRAVIRAGKPMRF